MGLSILWLKLFEQALKISYFNVQWEWVRTVDNAVALGKKILHISSLVADDGTPAFSSM